MADANEPGDSDAGLAEGLAKTLLNKPVKHIKKILDEHGVDARGCVDKAELAKLAADAVSRSSDSASQLDKDADTCQSMHEAFRAADSGSEISTGGKTGTCAKCDSRPENTHLSACSRCKMTFYCSKECQKLDWKRHKKVCGHLALLGGLENDNNPSPWIHSYDIVFQDAALDKLKWTGPRSFAGLSDEAVRVFACSPELRGPNSTFSHMLYSQRVVEELHAVLSPEIQKGFEENRRAVARLPSKNRVAAAQLLFTRSLISDMIRTFSKHSEEMAAERAKRSKKLRSHYDQRLPGIVAVECNEFHLDDLLLKEGELPVGSFGFVWVPRPLIKDYINARYKSVFSQQPEANVAHAGDYVLRTILDSVAQHKGVTWLLLYRHAFDAQPGFAVNTFTFPERKEVEQINTFKTTLTQSRLGDAQAFSLTLPSCQLTFHDGDQANFKVMAPIDPESVSAPHSAVDSGDTN